MKLHTEALASGALIAITFVFAVVCISMATQGDARSDRPATRVTAEMQQAAKPCPECYVQPPFNPGYELPKDMKAAEPVATF